MATNHNDKRKSQKLSGAGKITLTALSFVGFIGSWNLIARLEGSQATADEAVTPQQVVPAPLLNPVQRGATPWPTIAPVIARPEIPTLVPTLTTLGQTSTIGAVPATLEPLQLAPIPTPIPLPTLAPLPDLSVPPPPPLLRQPQPVQQASQSGGS